MKTMLVTVRLQVEAASREQALDRFVSQVVNTPIDVLQEYAIVEDFVQEGE